MTEPKKIKAKVISISYVKEAQSVLMLLECEKGKFRSQIHRSSIATFGDRTEEMIDEEMEKYTDMLKGIYLNKEIYIVFDTELEDKIKDNYPLKY